MEDMIYRIIFSLIIFGPIVVIAGALLYGAFRFIFAIFGCIFSWLFPSKAKKMEKAAKKAEKKEAARLGISLEEYQYQKRKKAEEEEAARLGVSLEEYRCQKAEEHRRWHDSPDNIAANLKYLFPNDDGSVKIYGQTYTGKIGAVKRGEFYKNSFIIYDTNLDEMAQINAEDRELLGWTSDSVTIKNRDSNKIEIYDVDGNLKTERYL